MSPEIKTIYEDDDILVIDKPAGLEVCSEIKKDEPTLVDWLVGQYPAIAKVGPDPARPGIVHRIDKNVSGLLVIAKSEAAFESLIKQFKERKIEKEYIALVHGSVLKDEGAIEFSIARAKSGRFAALPVGHDGGKMAVSEYEVVKRFKNFTLLKVRIKTGRTHQIRVHLYALGHPVVGDHLYKQRKIKDKLDLGRIFLHAAKLSFTDLGGKKVEFKSELPKELEMYLSSTC